MKNQKERIRQFKEQIPELSELYSETGRQPMEKYLGDYHFETSFIKHYRAGEINRENQNLFVQCFYAKEHKGTVFLVHGYLDHSGGLSVTINELLRHGYTVFTVDLPGHGLSQGEEGSIHSFKEYIDAVEDAYRAMHSYIPSGEIIGLGHSTGAAILFQSIGQKRIRLDRLVMAAPLYLPYQWKKTKGIIKMLSRIMPTSKRAFKRNSDDELYHQFITRDPLQVHYLKADWFFAMADWQEEIRYSPIVRLPVYLIQGERDTTVDAKRTISFYEQKCRYLQVCLVPEARHQVLNERQVLREFVHRRILSFLDGTDRNWR
ncbi:alpha/beta hydrolase [Salisediminibacterium beveridgei]|nr:alpha/beta hydrolase [Salisediminibacterium beveridgei]